MANIPKEVVESCILPRLPVKSLVRFKCVSKSWKTLISSSEFLHLHNGHANRLLVTSINDDTLLQVHNLDSPLDPSFLCPYPYNEELSWPGDKMTVLASCEFFILVGCWTPHAISSLFLLNPSTLSYHRIPFEGVQRRLSGSTFTYGLYFDEVNDDCKVVRIVDFILNVNEYAWEVKIYSSKTNLWRLIEHKVISSRPLYRLISNSFECLNNLLYVIVESLIDYRIRCFDIQAERWTDDIVFPRKIELPSACILDGSLCVLGLKSTYVDKVRTRTYCAWVLNDNGVEKSWVKLMSIVPKNCQKPKYRPIAYRKGSRHELLCRRFCNSELFWYDLKYKESTRAESDGCARDGSVLLCNVDHICKESLMCFHGGERIKLNKLGKEGEEDQGKAI